jgi:hypothetical protein
VPGSVGGAVKQQPRQQHQAAAEVEDAQVRGGGDGGRLETWTYRVDWQGPSDLERLACMVWQQQQLQCLALP